MRRFVLAALTILCSAGFAAAQGGTLNLNPSDADTLRPLAPAKADHGPFANGDTDIVAVTLVPINLDPRPATAVPAPTPAPRPLFGQYEGFRFQLAAGYSYFRFRSALFNSNMNGLQTSLSYFLNDWFAVEGNTIAAFGSSVFGERSKALLFTGGARVAWRGGRRRFEPWMHGLVGGLHMLPQTAAGGKVGFAVQAGGGVDYRLSGRASARFGGDYIRSQLYSASQSNFQVGGGLVINF